MNSVLPYAVQILAQAEGVETATNTNLLIRGILALSIAIIFLIGSVWLLLSLIIGVRMGYLVMGSVLFGVIMILSLIWTATALGPKNPETTWFGSGAGADIAQLEHEGETYDVSDYPGGEWREPKKGEHLADLEGEEDTLSEQSNAIPVLRAFISQAINEETRGEIADLLESDVGLVAGEFETVDIRFKETLVNEKESLITVARAVPSERITAENLPVEEAEVERYLVKIGDEVASGDPVLEATADGRTFEVAASAGGKVLLLGQRKGDAIKDGVPIATVDISEQSGAPAPVEVGAVRVPGFPRKPAIVWLFVSAILFAIHLGLLRGAERARRPKAKEPEEEKRELVPAS
jgi:hypothetical protein